MPDKFSADEEDLGPSMADMGGALRDLALLGSDSWLSMQATNLAVVDQFIMTVELEAVRAYYSDERDISGLIFLGAQTQLWLFGLYELLRTWRQRSKDVLKWHKNGGLQHKIDHLRRDQGFKHFGSMSMADQLERVKDDVKILDTVSNDLKRTHVTFARLEHLRVSLAKHEVKGSRNSVAYAPGYARINREDGSLEYELSSGRTIYDVVSRRAVADGVRAFFQEIPDQKNLEEFDSVFGRIPDFDEL